MADEHLTRLAELMETASPPQKGELLHELLTWFGNDTQAIEVIVGWAEDADLLPELHAAALDRLSEEKD